MKFTELFDVVEAMSEYQKEVNIINRAATEAANKAVAEATDKVAEALQKIISKSEYENQRGEKERR